MYRLFLAASLVAISVLGSVGSAKSSQAAVSDSMAIHRVNAGGPEVDAPHWERDRARRASPHLISKRTKTASTRRAMDISHPSVPEGIPAAVFKDHRNRTHGRALRFGFPVKPGEYEVRLLFAEIRKIVGVRIMNVRIEGTKVLDRFNVLKSVGPRTAVVRSFKTLSDSVLNVRIFGRKGRPMINGMEILSTDGSHLEPPSKADPEPPLDSEPIDDCIGVEVNDGGDALVDAMATRSGPTTYCLARGTYTAGVLGFPVESGDVIHGAGVTETFLSSDSAQRVIDGRRADNVTITGVDIQGGRDDGGKSACDKIHARCGRGIEPGDGWTIRNARVHHADASGIASPGHSLVVDNVELDHNGLQWNGPKNNGIAAGIKGGEAGAFIITNSYVHDNNQGIWCDVDCDSLNGGFIVQDNHVLDNCSFGIHYENTYKDPSTPASATITDNVVRGNNWCELPSKAEIGIVSAQNAAVRNNVFGDTLANPAPGYGFTAFDRGLGQATGSARENTFNGDRLRKCESPYSCR